MRKFIYYIFLFIILSTQTFAQSGSYKIQANDRLDFSFWGSPELNSTVTVDRDGEIELPIIGLAKQFEHIYSPNSKRPISLQKSSEGLYLLQRIRDEAHRFAIAYHRKLRSKTTISARLV